MQNFKCKISTMVDQHNYKKMIVEMLNKIDNSNQLKKVFDYTCFVYLKCPMVEKVNK